VEGKLTILVDAEADQLWGPSEYATRYERNLRTKAGEICLEVAELRTFETANVERYRRESSVEEALIGVFLQLIMF
jgi:hypothetical protein